MDWIIALASSIAGSLVGGFLGYALGINSRPRFRLLGITGNRVGSINPFNQVSQYSLQCGVMFRVSYRFIGERFIAKNARGWVAIIDDHGNEVHAMHNPWAIDGNPLSMDLVGEESLILLQIVPPPSSASQVNAILVFPNTGPTLTNWN